MSGSPQERPLDDIAKYYHGVTWCELSREQRERFAWDMFETGVALEKTVIALRKIAAALDQLQGALIRSRTKLL